MGNLFVYSINVTFLEYINLFFKKKEVVFVLNQIYLKNDIVNVILFFFSLPLIYQIYNIQIKFMY